MKQAQLLETVRSSLQYSSYLKTAILSVTAAARPTSLYIVQSSANDYNIVAIYISVGPFLLKVMHRVKSTQRVEVESKVQCEQKLQISNNVSYMNNTS